MKKIKIIPLATFASLFVIVISCSKNKQPPQQLEAKQEIKSTRYNYSQDNSEWALSIPYPTSASLSELFQKDKLLLKQIVLNNNESLVEGYVRNLADQIAGYYYYNKNIDLRQDFSDDPASVIVFGLFYAAKEVYDQEQSNYSKRDNKKKKDIAPYFMPEDPFSCFMTAVETFIGISEAKSIWKAIVSGASEQTAVAALKLIGKRVGTVLGVAIMVYQAGKCIGFW